MTEVRFGRAKSHASSKKSSRETGHPRGGVSTKSTVPAALLCFFLGTFGVHRFYVGKIGTGILMLLTLGGLGVWAIIDFVKIMVGSFEDKDGLPLEKPSNSRKQETHFRGDVSSKNMVPAALLCFFLGSLGVHRFYVGKIGTGILMLLTLGGLGVWAIIDFVRIVVGSFKDKDGLPLHRN